MLLPETLMELKEYSSFCCILLFAECRGRSGGAMVLGKLPVQGRSTIWIQ